MKKIILLPLLICISSLVFAQFPLDLGLGFQYGTARVFYQGETTREITEPGVVFNLRVVPDTIGFFGHIGLLFPSSVTFGGTTLTYNDYDYILFLNSAMGVSFKAPLNDRLGFFFDAGISINNMFYGGSFKDTIDASWTIKLENLGTTYTGGHKYENIKMKESYNDVSFGILGSPGMRFYFTRTVFFELGAAVSFDFLRVRSYKFYADFTSGRSEWQDWALADFPHDKLEIEEEHGVEKAKKLILDSNSQGSTFKQFTFIPRLSVGISF